MHGKKSTETSGVQKRKATISGGFDYLAEREGFEPSVPVKIHTLSRRAPSTTQTSLHPLPLYKTKKQMELFRAVIDVSSHRVKKFHLH